MLLNLQEADGPLHRRIDDALKSAIHAGRLGPGARLPSTRTLATDLDVSRNTVTLAYEQLVAEGYVVSRNRSTMSVASGMPPRPPPESVRPSRKDRPRLSAYGQRLIQESRHGAVELLREPARPALRLPLRQAGRR